MRRRRATQAPPAAPAAPVTPAVSLAGLARSETLRWGLTLGLFLIIFSQAVIERRDYFAVMAAGLLPDRPARFGGDAEGYYRIAMTEPLPCFNTSREPLLPALGRLCILAFGSPSAPLSEPGASAAAAAPAAGSPAAAADPELENQLLLRRLSISFSLLGMLAFTACALMLCGRTVALLSALLWAFSGWDMHYAVAFLRTNLAIALHLLCIVAFVVLLRRAGRPLRSRLVPAAAAAVLLALTIYLDVSLLTVAVLLLGVHQAVLLLCRRWSRRELALGAGIGALTLLLASPYLVYNIREAGEPFPMMDHHAWWWACHEFAGQPGFPTRAQLVAGDYGEDGTTVAGYIFGMHSLPEVVGRYARGYLYALGFDVPRRSVFIAMRRVHSFPWIMVLLPLGMVLLCWRSPEGLWATLASLVTFLPYAFIITLDTVITVEPPRHPIGVEARFVLGLLPIAFLSCAVALAGLLRLLGDPAGTVRRLRQLAARRFLPPWCRWAKAAPSASRDVGT